MTAEWVPSSWDAVKTGDTVRLVHKTVEPAAEGKVRFAHPVYLNLWGFGWTQFQIAEYDLFVPAPTTPLLPSEPNTIWADKTGHPWFVTDMGNLVTHQISIHGPAELAAPFVKLEPTATTAKQIIDRIDAMRAGGEVTTLGQVQTLLAAEFGVES